MSDTGSPEPLVFIAEGVASADSKIESEHFKYLKPLVRTDPQYYAFCVTFRKKNSFVILVLYFL